MDIEDIHPLRSRAKFDHIVPALACFRRCCKAKPDFNHALRKTLLKDMAIKMPKSDSELVEKPFLILGYGVNAYFDIMLSLVWMFASITIFVIPLFYAYSQNETKALKNFGKYPITQYSLGNMGGSSVTHASAKLKLPQIYIECYTGEMHTSDFEFGVMPNDIYVAKYLTNEALFGDVANKDRHNCTDEMDKDVMQKRIVAECAGKGNCTVPLANWAKSGAAADTVSGAGVCGDDATFFL